MQDRQIPVYKSRRTSVIMILAIAVIFAVVSLLSKEMSLEGSWIVESTAEWQEYTVSIEKVDLPFSFDLYSDGSGIKTNNGHGRHSDVTWYAEKGRVRIGNEVYSYKVSFGKLTLNYQDGERNDELTYIKK